MTFKVPGRICCVAMHEKLISIIITNVHILPQTTMHTKGHQVEQERFHFFIPIMHIYDVDGAIVCYYDSKSRADGDRDALRKRRPFCI